MQSGNDFATMLRRIQHGDHEVLGTLLRDYEPALRRFARAHLGPGLRPYADSLDLVQSVHMSLLLVLRGNRYDFSSPQKLLALARTILRRKVARLAERSGRQRRADVRPDNDEASLGLLQSLPSPQPGPAESAEAHNALEHVCRLLTERERHILTLLLQGHTRKEIAQRLGEDPHVFRVYWGRVVARVRESGALNSWLEPSLS